MTATLHPLLCKCVETEQDHGFSSVFSWHDDEATLKGSLKIVFHLMCVESVEHMMSADIKTQIYGIDANRIPLWWCQKGNLRSVSSGSGSKTFSCWR